MRHIHYGTGTRGIASSTSPGCRFRSPCYLVIMFYTNFTTTFTRYWRGIGKREAKLLYRVMVRVTEAVQELTSAHRSQRPTSVLKPAAITRNAVIALTWALFFHLVVKNGRNSGAWRRKSRVFVQDFCTFAPDFRTHDSLLRTERR